MDTYTDELETLRHLHDGLEWILTGPVQGGAKRELVKAATNEMCGVIGGIAISVECETRGEGPQPRSG